MTKHKRALILALSKLPAFKDGTWEWNGGKDAHYEGDRVHPNGRWLVRRRDPHAQSPGTMLTLAEDFERNAPKRFLLAVEAFLAFHQAIAENRQYIRKQALRDMVRTLDNEIAVVRRSFERADNHPFRVHLTDEVLDKEAPLYSIECAGAKLFFQFDQLRNCAKQDSRAYTIEQLEAIDSTLKKLLNDFVRDIEGDFNTTITRELK